jgi:IS5 family transposase
VPLAVEITPANANECNMLQPMLDKIPSIHGSRGRPRFRPDKLHADKAYDHVFCRAGCRIRGVVPRIAVSHRPLTFAEGIDSTAPSGRARGTSSARIQD